MTINLRTPDITELKPRITVFGVGGGGGNAVNNMINAGLRGVEFVCANTDAQALAMSKAEKLIQLGANVTEGLGAGSQPEVGRAAAEECIDEILDQLTHTHMCFVTAGMGGGTGTGAAPVVARAARERGILTVGVVTKPFHFEGQRRMRTAELGIEELQACVDTLIVIPNQNLFRIANDKTTFADAFAMADQVLYSGVACITDLMVKEGLINLDFADVRSVMREMGKAMMGTGEASGDGRAMAAAEAAIANPLLDETSMKGAKGLLISITGGRDMTLFEVDEAATRIREEVDPDANIILGATFDEDLEGVIRVSVVATGIDKAAIETSTAPAAVRATPRPAQSQQKPSVVGGQPSGQLHAPQPTPARETYASASSEAELINRQIDAVAAAASAQPAQQVANGGFQPQSKLFRQMPQESVLRPAQQHAPRPAAVAQPQVMQQPAAAPQFQQQQAPAPVQPQMPPVTNLPPQVQAQVHHAAAQEHEDRGPMGLLKRLTQGLSRRDDEEHTTQPPEPRLRQAEPRRTQDSQFYAPARGQLDEQGRLVPQQQQARHQEEDHLEIPAFLRRQAN